MGLARFFITQPMREQAVIFVAMFMTDAASRNRKVKGKIEMPSVDASLNRLYSEVAAYIRQHKLGVVRRAAFAFAIQEALREQHLPAEVVSKVTSALVINALIAQKNLDC